MGGKCGIATFAGCPWRGTMGKHGVMGWPFPPVSRFFPHCPVFRGQKNGGNKGTGC